MLQGNAPSILIPQTKSWISQISLSSHHTHKPSLILSNCPPESKPPPLVSWPPLSLFVKQVNSPAENLPKPPHFKPEQNSKSLPRDMIWPSPTSPVLSSYVLFVLYTPTTLLPFCPLNDPNSFLSEDSVFATPSIMLSSRSVVWQDGVSYHLGLFHPS